MKARTYYLVGIGGIGMSAIARYLKEEGNNVFGYDRVCTALTKELEQEGVEIVYEDDSSHIATLNVDEVIYTPAIPSDSAILRYVKEMAIPLFKRSEALGRITRGKKTIAVAGTHGKTTTAGLTAHILKNSRIGCSAFLGGISNNYSTNFLINHNSDYVVVEADEYDRSFLRLSPFFSLITSIAEDHLDIYGNLDNLEQAFIQFANLTDKNGRLFLKNNLPVKIESEVPETTYSLTDVDADCYASNIRVSEGTYYFDFHTPDKVYHDMKMTYPGRHNIENAVASLSMALSLGVTECEFRGGLATFKGMKRRFDLRIKTDKTIYYDDYAHHPQEIEATIKSLKELYPDKRICGVFQPHLYSRTRDFADEFAQSLELLDNIILLPIYPAREEPIEGITSDTILGKIRKSSKYYVEKDRLLPLLKTLQPELLVTLGAGDIDRFVEPITEMIRENE
mgnify:FL=1